MSVRTIAAKYQELVTQGKHFEFMRTLYAPGMVSVEGDGTQTVGKEQVIRKSEIFQNGVNFHSQDLRGPFFLGDANANSGQFGVYFALEFSPKAGGDRRRHEEVGIYTVTEGVVTREEFFYDGAFL